MREATDQMLDTKSLVKGPAEEDQLDKLHLPKEAPTHLHHLNLKTKPLNQAHQVMDSGTCHHQEAVVVEVALLWEEGDLIVLEKEPKK